MWVNLCRGSVQYVREAPASEQNHKVVHRHLREHKDIVAKAQKMLLDGPPEQQSSGSHDSAGSAEGVSARPAPEDPPRGWVCDNAFVFVEAAAAVEGADWGEIKKRATVSIYSGSFNIRGMTAGDLDFIVSLAANSEKERPFVDVSHFPYVGGPDMLDKIENLAPCHFGSSGSKWQGSPSLQKHPEPTATTLQ